MPHRGGLMKPHTRRIVQAVLYEAIAVGFVGPVLAWLFKTSMTSALALAVLMSTVALVWSYLFNTLFERWEAGQARKGRSLLRRVAHSSAFEGGLVVMLVPVMAWWLDTSLLAALLADLGVLAFFFVYSFVFTWAFDRVFGLPASAAMPLSTGSPLP
jgi:uncharacterized membrane protein